MGDVSSVDFLLTSLAYFTVSTVDFV